MKKFGASYALAAAATAFLVAAAPAAAVTFSWNGSGDFDIESQAITATNANSVSFSPAFGAYAHSHGQDVNFTITATIDGLEQTIYSQLLTGGNEQYLYDLGTVSFTQGVVTSIGFGCDSCSGYTYHGFNGSSFNVGASAVPEAATWSLMIVGFGLVGVTARRRNQAAIAA